jgi:hypothetical protein
MDRSALARLVGFPATLVHGDPLVLDRWFWLKARLPKTRNDERLLEQIPIEFTHNPHARNSCKLRGGIGCRRTRQFGGADEELFVPPPCAKDGGTTAKNLVLAHRQNHSVERRVRMLLDQTPIENPHASPTARCFHPAVWSCSGPSPEST